MSNLVPNVASPMSRIDELFNQAIQLSANEQRKFLKTLEPGEREQLAALLAADAESPSGFLKSLGLPETESEEPVGDEPQSGSSDRNLLFGVLAWQAGVVKEQQLLAAMQAWTFSKATPLGQILVEQSAITEQQRTTLEPMVAAHLQLHGGEAAKAIASLSSVPHVAASLKRHVDDSDLQTSLQHLGQTLIRDPQANEETLVASNSPGDTEFEAVVGDRFRVIRTHARGGLGEVFVAKDRELNREVALKEIQPQFANDADSRSRFVLEAEVTGGLEHPGIVPVYGLGQYEDGRPYYAMRFIKGDSLKDAIKAYHENKDLSDSERTLQLRKLLGRVVDVCEAIGYAHSRGVLHRDLKPGNIMLGKYGETLVVDWGLAKVAGRDEPIATDEQTLHPQSGSSVNPTVMGSAIGTPAYMPPEQAAGKLDQLGPPSDVYSLGATLYHILTGQAPHQGKQLADVLKDVTNGRLEAPRQLEPSVDRSLEAVCLKAMSTVPANRYSSVQGLASDIERFLADEPVEAIREPLSVRTRRWIRNHQTLAATTAALMLLSAVGLGLFQKYRSDRAEEDLVKQTEVAREEARLRTAADEKEQLATEEARRADKQAAAAAAAAKR
ncbi:MAG: serine/threonine-protein kinase, partial [Planctomycetaceae bacterium]